MPVAASREFSRRRPADAARGRMGLWRQAVLLAGVAWAGAPCSLPAAAPEPADALPQLIRPDPNSLKLKSVGQLEKLVAKSDPPACFELADRLTEGNGIAVDLVRARTLFEQAAKGGVADAWFRLGKIYCAGLGVPQDYAKGFACYAEGAARGVPEAQHNVGAMLVSARGVKRDYVEGLAWIILAVQAGADAEAEAQVRARLANRPADIAAAEARARELQEAIKQAKPLAPKATVVSPADAAPFQPEKPVPPKVDLPAPKVDVPAPQVAPPASPTKP